ncbi:MAG: hypothetical protein M3Q28_11775 [Pseudomonadota bacterium]|nr:hypothetical protein [Pseudomonadota bacterium]
MPASHVADQQRRGVSSNHRQREASAFIYFNKLNGKLQELHQKWLKEDLQKDLPTF